MRVLYDRVAAIDVHKDMVKVAIRVPGAKRGTRKTDVLEFRTFYGVLQAMGRELRGRGVTHVVMEASGVYTDPVYYALRELDFEEVMVINPAHAKALKGHKTDAKDAIRLLDLYECGLLSGSYIPDPDLREVRDLGRYRMKTVQARTSEIQRLQKALETAGIKFVLGRVRCYRGLGDGDDRGADQRGTPRRGDGGPGADPAAHRREDGGPVDGPGRPVQDRARRKALTYRAGRRHGRMQLLRECVAQRTWPMYPATQVAEGAIRVAAAAVIAAGGARGCVAHSRSAAREASGCKLAQATQAAHPMPTLPSPRRVVLGLLPPWPAAG